MRGIFGWKVYVVTSGKPDQGIIMHGERANLVVACPSRASLVKEHAGMGGGTTQVCCMSSKQSVQRMNVQARPGTNGSKQASLRIFAQASMLQGLGTGESSRKPACRGFSFVSAFNRISWGGGEGAGPPGRNQIYVYIYIYTYIWCRVAASQAPPPPPMVCPPPSPKRRLSFQQTVIRHRNCPPS